MNALLPNAFRPDPASTAGNADLAGAGLDPSRLAAELVVQLRHHSHFNNVLTHVSRDNWPRVEQALARLLGNVTGALALDELSVNLLTLLSGERGTTGRMMKPWFAEQMRHYTSAARSRTLEQRLAMLHAVYTSAPVVQKKSIARILRDAK